jgi:ubiquinone/menaquinone biosynthesis C-methylase UbiE
MTYTPAAGHHWLTPLYDFGVATLTREHRWRRALTDQVRPRACDVIVDIGCGTGSQLARFGQAAPRAQLIGIDPDPEMLVRTKRRLSAVGLAAELKIGFVRQAADLLADQRPTKIVSSLVFHQVPLEEKAAGFAAIHRALSDGGEVHVADYGLQRTPLMKALFRGVIQNLDGRINTEPNARGVLPALMQDAGFHNVRETLVIPTPSGSISLYRAIRAP